MATRKVFPERWTVYRITNTVNGKCYVGVTGTSLTERWQWHIWAARRTCNKHFAICAAILKYGPDSFMIENISSYTDCEQAIVQEIYLIARYNSQTPNGYNMTSGGDGVPGLPPYHRSIDTRLKIAQIKGGKNHLPGAIWMPDRNKWKAIFSINSKRIYLGQFDTPQEASAIYLQALEECLNNKFQPPHWKDRRGIPRSFETRYKMALARNPLGLPGAKWSSKERKWLAYISINGKQIRLGSFRTPEEASAVWVAALKAQFNHWREPLCTRSSSSLTAVNRASIS